MARLKRLYLGGTLLDVPHPFEEELDYLVSAGHRLVMERVSRLEEEGAAKVENEDLPEMHAYFEEVRKAANKPSSGGSGHKTSSLAKPLCRRAYKRQCERQKFNEESEDCESAECGG
jgi:hypothetical protein